jgi:hypothetical protein
MVRTRNVILGHHEREPQEVARLDAEVLKLYARTRSLLEPLIFCSMRGMWMKRLFSLGRSSQIRCAQAARGLEN